MHGSLLCWATSRWLQLQAMHAASLQYCVLDPALGMALCSHGPVCMRMPLLAAGPPETHLEDAAIALAPFWDKLGRSMLDEVRDVAQ